MSNVIDLTGKRFGRLVVIEPTKERKNESVVWRCRCDCGKYTNVITSNLTKGNTKSCGCLSIKDLTGKRFGRLVAIEPTEKRKNSSVVWKCRCDCGNITYAPSDQLTRLLIKSCGCLHSEVSSNHAKNIRKNAYEILGLHDGTMDCRLNNTIPSNNSTGVRGVSRRQNGKYFAQIIYKGKNYCLGTFEDLEQAKEARKIAEKKIWGKDLE